MAPRHTVTALAVGGLSAVLGASSFADDVDVTDELVVRGRWDNPVGYSVTASQGVVGAEELDLRPRLRTGEILEVVPGLIVTQHSGSGKSNQMFLRGFNLDHGTDFATWVDGMPVNMPTHAHGQGYTDMNFVIPELVERLEHRKGGYYAEVSDFSAAGSAELATFRRLDEGLVKVGAGEDGYVQALVAERGPTTPSGTSRSWPNFTYLLDDPVDGDQFEQLDDRTITGGRFALTYGSGTRSMNTLGVMMRNDDIGDVGLFRTANRQRLSTVRRDSVEELSLGLYYSNETHWNDRVRTILGVRADHYDFDVTSDLPANSGTADDSLVTPKERTCRGRRRYPSASDGAAHGPRASELAILSFRLRATAASRSRAPRRSSQRAWHPPKDRGACSRSRARPSVPRSAR
jgi:outer membrane receptor protein involved in Fe transport